MILLLHVLQIPLLHENGKSAPAPAIAAVEDIINPFKTWNIVKRISLPPSRTVTSVSSASFSNIRFALCLSSSDVRKNIIQYALYLLTIQQKPFHRE